MADPISQAAAAFANWAYTTFFAAAGYGTTAHAVISATLYYGAQAALYAGVSMGLSAVAQAQIPTPEAQKLTKKQSRPPRQFCGGGPVRQSGPYVLRETVGSKLALVIALADQRLASIGDVYLNDDKTVLIDGWVQEGADGRYGTGDLVQVDYRLGLPIEARHTIFPADFDGVWPETARGDGIASLAVFAQHRSRESFSTHFPNGEVIPSAVIQAVCYDWRDETQDRENESTWKATSNPIVWLVHLEWWLFGRNWNRAIEPMLHELTLEADYCDALIPKVGGMEPRYRWAGGWLSNTEPAAIRSHILAACDGWLTTDGRGRLIIKAGRYDEPTFVIPPEHIVAYSWRRGQTDEEACNELIVSYVSPDHDFTEVECDPWRDEDDIASRGKVRSEGLGLTWVSHHTQARRLAKRKMSRLNAPRRGTVRTGVYGLNGLGERYIRVQNPEITSMADVVCEVMNVEVDFNSASVTFEVIEADPGIDAWDPMTEEGAAPPVPAAAPVRSFVEQPAEFSAARDGSAAVLSWRNPFDGVFDFVNVLRSQNSSFASASIVGFYGGGTGQLVNYRDEAPGATPYYWLVSVDAFGRESAPLGPVSAAPPAKSYADFVAHITAKATGGSKNWSGQLGSTSGGFFVTAAAATGTMYGSSNGRYVTSDSTVARVIQHAMPSSVVFNEQVSAARKVYFEMTDVGSQTGYVALDRNGYLSLNYSDWAGARVDLVIWWDEATRQAMQRNPYGDGPATPYPF